MRRARRAKPFAAVGRVNRAFVGDVGDAFDLPPRGVPSRIVDAGAGLTTSTTTTATLDAYASSSPTYSAGKGYYAEAESTKSGFDALTATTVEEKYGTNWSGSVASDPTLAGLRASLDSAAAAGEATRAAREADFRKRVLMVSTLAGPAGLLLWALGEGFLFLGNLLSKPIEGNSPADRDAAVAAVGALWERWRIAPPTFAADVSTARSYAATVRQIVSYLDSTDTGEHAWRDKWVAVVDKAIKLTEEKKYDILRDASLLGLFPTQIERWAPRYWTSPVDGVKWGERYVSGKDKYGDPVHSTTWTLDQFRKVTDPQAAGIGIMVAAATGARWETCIETAVARNVAHAAAIGAYYNVQFWRLRAVFLDTLNAATTGTIPSRFRVVSTRSTPVPVVAGGALSGEGARLSRAQALAAEAAKKKKGGAGAVAAAAVAAWLFLK